MLDAKRIALLKKHLTKVRVAAAPKSAQPSRKIEPVSAPTVDSEPLLKDKEVAKLVGLSPQWIRKERMNRRRGQPHVFDIDPVMVGENPRYRAADVRRWLAARPKDQRKGPSK